MENRTWGKDVGLSDAIGHLTLKFFEWSSWIVPGLRIGKPEKGKARKHANI